jgi:hypothetical protein
VISDRESRRRYGSLTRRVQSDRSSDRVRTVKELHVSGRRSQSCGGNGRRKSNWLTID